MLRAAFLVTMAFLVFGYQDCGKLGNSGAPSSSSGISASLNQSSYSGLAQYQDTSQMAAGETTTVKNLQPIQAGDLLVVFLDDASTSFVSQIPGVTGCPCVPTDTSGNTYVNISGTNFYYAANVAAAAAGANTITINFKSATGPSELIFFDLTGMETTSPLDSAVTSATAATFSSMITTSQPDIILGGLNTVGYCASWAGGWSMQVTNHNDCWAYLSPTSAGTFSATGTISAAGTGTLQIVAFKKAVQNKPQFTLQQINEKVAGTAATTISVPMSSDQMAGDLNIVSVSWATPAVAIAGPGLAPHFVTDTKNNVYTLVGTVSGAGITQSIWYAQNIVAAAAGTNAVSVEFSAAITSQMTVSEYGGSKTGALSPLDQANGNAGTGTFATTGYITTNYPNELIFTSIAEGVGQDVTGVSSGFRILPVQNTSINPGVSWYSTADSVATSTGTFSNGFTLSSSKSFASSIVSFH